MLEISKIRTVTSMDEEHRKLRLGRITASMFGKLVSEKSHLGQFSRGGITYLEHLAYERVNGKPAKSEFHSDYTDRGNAYEDEAIVHFCKTTGLYILRDENNHDTHRLIEHNEYVACTPDALTITSQEPKKIFDASGTKIKVTPLEIKCPLPKFVKFYKCLTPANVKEVERIYYWQVIFQMYCCDSLKAYFAVYHPEFNRKPTMRIIEFHRAQLLQDIRILHLTIQHATQKLIEEVEYLKAA